VKSGFNEKVLTAPTQSDLHWLATGFDGTGAKTELTSYDWRDETKKKTFYLADLSDQDRSGPTDSTLWKTYCHVYPNNFDGITIQYWRFHGYNSGLSLNIQVFGRTLQGGFHGGDWEGIQVALGANAKPIRARFFGA
jgi:hypothetical protein